MIPPTPGQNLRTTVADVLSSEQEQSSNEQELQARIYLQKERPSKVAKSIETS